jgi:DNA polymerase-3 subunit epsilon
MTYVVWDTETTGLPLFNLRSTDPRQPLVVQIAMLMLADDGSETSMASLIVRPEGWTVPEDVTAIHGISHERAMDEGVSENLAALLFVDLQARASLRVAHNESFDRRIMRIAMTRAGVPRDVIEAIEARPSFCTCKAAQPIIRLPPTERMVATGRTGAKPPKLEECIRFFFNEELAGGHDALIDARACARVYRAIIAIDSAAPATAPLETTP